MLGKRAAGASFILLLVLAACGRGSREEAEAVSQQSAETPVEAFFRYGPVNLGSTRGELRGRLGEPDSVGVATVSNRHDPSLTDSVFTLHYPGLSAEIYRASYDGRELLAAVVIADDRHLRPESPLRIGVTEEEVRLLLGAPSGGPADALRYPCTSCDAAGYDVLELRLADGQLQRITLRYWID
jgi:hypothetical protein